MYRKSQKNWTLGFLSYMAFPVPCWHLEAFLIFWGVPTSKSKVTKSYERHFTYLYPCNRTYGMGYQDLSNFLILSKRQISAIFYASTTTDNKIRLKIHFVYHHFIPFDVCCKIFKIRYKCAIIHWV